MKYIYMKRDPRFFNKIIDLGKNGIGGMQFSKEV